MLFTWDGSSPTMTKHVLSALIRRPWRGRQFAVLVAGLVG